MSYLFFMWVLPHNITLSVHEVNTNHEALLLCGMSLLESVAILNRWHNCAGVPACHPPLRTRGAVGKHCQACLQQGTAAGIRESCGCHVRPSRKLRGPDRSGRYVRLLEGLRTLVHPKLCPTSDRGLINVCPMLFLCFNFACAIIVHSLSYALLVLCLSCVNPRCVLMVAPSQLVALTFPIVHHTSHISHISHLTSHTSHLIPHTSYLIPQAWLTFWSTWCSWGRPSIRRRTSTTSTSTPTEALATRLQKGSPPCTSSISQGNTCLRLWIWYVSTLQMLCT